MMEGLLLDRHFDGKPGVYILLKIYFFFPATKFFIFPP